MFLKKKTLNFFFIELYKKCNKSKYKLVDSTKIITGILESTKSSISTISMNLNVK